MIDVSAHEVYINSERTNFTATEFRLLHFLASHPGRVFSQAQLVIRSLETALLLLTATLMCTCARFRILGEYRHLIETVRSVVYRFHQEH